MKAYEIGDYARSGKLTCVERPDPQPGPGEALIRIRATGPNARDFAIWTTGIWKGAPPPTLIPLCDMAGEVVATGPGVSQVAIGDRVTMIHYSKWLDGDWHVSMREEDFAQTRDGFLCELAAVPADALVRIPANLTFEEAATLPSAGLTAWQAVVEEGRLKPGHTVVTIGTGGVSIFALQWAKMMGARVIVTSSSDEKLDRVKALGADETINYARHPEWHKAVLNLTDGEGAHLVINNVGLPELDACLEATRSGGRVMYIGATSVTSDRKAVGGVVPTRLGLLIIRDLTLKGIVVGSRRMMVDLVKALETYPNIRPVIDRVYDFDQANEAVQYFAKTGKVGKVVIRIP